MARSSQASRSVFVGNIPYSASEEQLEDIFRTVGQVVNFRLVKNPDTGQSKGYGFCEFRDVQTAESAIRNLHDTEIHGRTLRIAPAESHVGDGADKKFGGGDSRGGGGGGGGHRGPQSTHEMNQQINGLVGSMSPDKMYEILGQLKTICTQNREQARELFATHPHLALAVMRMQDRLQNPNSNSGMMPMAHDRPMGMPQGMDRGGGGMGHGPGGMGPHPGGLGGDGRGPGMGGPPGGMGPPHGMGPGPGMPRGFDDAGPGGAPYQGGGGPPANYGAGPSMAGPAAIGPPQGMGMSGPQGGMAGPPPQTQSLLANLTPEQRQQFQRLMTLTPEQIERLAMPPNVKQQVLALQAETRGGR